MPIKGLTDTVKARFPALGKLRKGGAKSSNGYGKDLNYFRFTSERPEIVEAFTAAYGAQPAALHVYLPYAGIDDNFAAWKEAWSAGGLQHRCDGETCVIWLDKTSGKYQHTPRPCPGGCDEVGRLVVILPELWRAGFVGYVTLETHSNHDIRNITASLLAVAEMRASSELGLRGVEFVLRRKPEQISTPGFGEDKSKRQHVEKWLVSIEPVPTWAETQLLAGTTPTAALPVRSSIVVTPSGFVDERTGEVVEPPEVEPDDSDTLDGEFAAIPSAREERAAQPVAKPAAPPAPTPKNGHDKPAPNVTTGPDGLPRCPKCGSAMWDNRSKVAEAQAQGKKPGPEWSCKAGKWNKDTRQTDGCDGKLWMGEWTPPSASAPAAPDTGHSDNGPAFRLDDAARARWGELAADLARDLPSVRGDDGKPNHKAIREDMAANGFTAITLANIEAAFAAVKQFNVDVPF